MAKTRKKPGWREEQAEYQRWLDRVNSMTLFDKNARPKMKPGKFVDPVVRGPVIDPSRLTRGSSLNSFVTGGTKPHVDPAVLYKEEPELLERELKARERKFATAPAYNKGPDILVTDDVMRDITAGITRRR